MWPRNRYLFVRRATIGGWVLATAIGVSLAFVLAYGGQL